MSRHILKLALAVGIAAPLLAVSASTVLANDTSSSRFGNWCIDNGCPGGKDNCMSYDYPAGGTLHCYMTVNQT